MTDNSSDAEKTVSLMQMLATAYFAAKAADAMTTKWGWDCSSFDISEAREKLADAMASTVDYPDYFDGNKVERIIGELRKEDGR